MPNDNELQIVLTLIDKASAKLKAIKKGIEKDTSDATETEKKHGEEAEKSGKKQVSALEKTSKALRDFRKELLVVTAAIVAITSVSKAWGEVNLQARQTLDSIGQSVERIKAMIGSMIFPIIQLVNAIVKAGAIVMTTWAAAWNAIRGLFTGGLQGMSDAWNKFFENLSKYGNIKAMTDKMKLMGDVLARIDLIFMNGKITAQEYYSTLISGSNAAYQNNQTYMQLTKQMAEQENLMRNNSLMDYSTDIHARMGLLKTLQEYHHTVYSSMNDFANMFIRNFTAGMTKALTSLVMHTKKASEAWKEFGQALITSIVEFVIQYSIQMLIAAALSKTILAATVGQASALAAAWLPAAVFASIATMGGADAAGASGFAAATGSSMAVGMATIATSKAIEGVSGFGHADGGWVGLHGPEIGLLGEKGPEYIVPNHQLNKMGGATINIEINNPVVRDEGDIDKLTEEVSKRLASEAERI